MLVKQFQELWKFTAHTRTLAGVNELQETENSLFT